MNALVHFNFNLSLIIFSEGIPYSEKGQTENNFLPVFPERTNRLLEKVCTFCNNFCSLYYNKMKNTIHTVFMMFIPGSYMYACLRACMCTYIDFSLQWLSKEIEFIVNNLNTNNMYTFGHIVSFSAFFFFFNRTYYNPEIIKDNGHLLNLVVKQTNSIIETSFELSPVNQFDQVCILVKTFYIIALTLEM